MSSASNELYPYHRYMQFRDYLMQLLDLSDQPRCPHITYQVIGDRLDASASVVSRFLWDTKKTFCPTKMLESFQEKCPVEFAKWPCNTGSITIGRDLLSIDAWYFLGQGPLALAAAKPLLGRNIRQLSNDFSMPPSSFEPSPPDSTPLPSAPSLALLQSSELPPRPFFSSAPIAAPFSQPSTYVSPPPLVSPAPSFVVAPTPSTTPLPPLETLFEQRPPARSVVPSEPSSNQRP